MKNISIKQKELKKHIHTQYNNNNNKIMKFSTNDRYLSCLSSMCWIRPMDNVYNKFRSKSCTYWIIKNFDKILNNNNKNNKEGRKWDGWMWIVEEEYAKRCQSNQGIEMRKEPLWADTWTLCLIVSTFSAKTPFYLVPVGLLLHQHSHTHMHTH